jgi:fermentation-respiration switch protein FrsA (DUF1100 family)
MKLWRSVLRCTLALAVCLAIAMLLLRIFEGRLVYFPSHDMGAPPENLGAAFEEAWIPVENGGQIHAWYFAQHKGQVQASDHVILVCHGNAGNISHRTELARLLLEAGASVLLFDYRGYGLSPGSPGEQNTYQDGEAACRWLEKKGYAATQIIGYGESLGGGVATELARRGRVGGLILQSTFTSIPDIGAEVYPWLPVRWISSIRYDTLRKLPDIKIPVLIMHSRQDRLIPFHHAEKNFAAANQPKSLCEIEGDHNDGIFVSHEKILAAVKDFLRRP